MNYIRNNQQGAALIVALIMLVIMTMLGLSAMNTSVVEERMAGNLRNKQLSFDAAEAAVREGEGLITCDGCVHAEIEPKDGVASPGLHEIETDPDLSDWWQKGVWWNPDHSHTPDTKWQARADDDISGVSAQPEYIIEHLGPEWRDPACDLDHEGKDECYRQSYRITARGWGMNTDAVSVIQTIVTDRD